jgi:hypothetical protein
MSVRALVCAVGLAVVLTASARGAPAPPLVIQGDRVLAGVRAGAMRAAVEAKLGPADSARRTSRGACRVVWRGLGLVLATIDFAQRAPCRGQWVVATVTGRTWRTAKGLRVGQPVARLRHLYPSARFHAGSAAERGWWLVARRRCAEAGGGPFPGLLARVRSGRVSALVVTVGVCE